MKKLSFPQWFKVYFRNAWETQQQLWWQLAWRAPQFDEGTIFMVNLPSDVYSYAEDYEIWAPANIIYNSIPNTWRLYPKVLYAGTAPLLVHGEKENRFIRNIQFDRDYTHALIVSMLGAASCVHVIDGDKFELSRSRSIPEVCGTARTSPLSPTF